ncbi:MAG: hypothetical protein BGO78_16045 [Chloroflexi bacterium 44-23]|nr:MAG: hypothetical protein BGO78_16045 [Chloroflexi bacterium 44-23]
MNNLAQIIQDLDLNLLTEQKDFSDIQIPAGYTSDLLSCVIAGAPSQGVWVTIQAHLNIIAVAALLELNAIIITEGALPDDATIAKANEEGISLFNTKRNSFWVVGKLWELGINAE